MKQRTGTQQIMHWLTMALFFFNVIQDTAPAQVLPPEARLAGNVWLLKACDVAEQDRLSAILRNFKTQFEAFFMDALDKGPDAQQLNEAEAAASKVFELRQEKLRTGKGLGLNQAQIQAARMVSREQYLARAKDDFVISYKARAVGGLGVVAGDKGVAVLRALAADSNSPLQISAEQALLQLTQPY
jgi:hypothetical protein